jgi:Domain of unknown function (DUF4158)
MPTRELLAPSRRAQFTDSPAPLDDRPLARRYTLSEHDLALIRRHRHSSTQLGLAVQLGYARFPGRALRVGEQAQVVERPAIVHPAMSDPPRPWRVPRRS